MGYYSTISGSISGISRKDYDNIKEHLKKVFEDTAWEEKEGGTLSISSFSKHYDNWMYPVYDKIAAVIQPNGKGGELEEDGEESGDIAMIFFTKDMWQQIPAKILFPENPFNK